MEDKRDSLVFSPGLQIPATLLNILYPKHVIVSMLGSISFDGFQPTVLLISRGDPGKVPYVGWHPSEIVFVCFPGHRFCTVKQELSRCTRSSAAQSSGPLQYLFLRTIQSQLGVPAPDPEVDIAPRLQYHVRPNLSLGSQDIFGFGAAMTTSAKAQTWLPGCLGDVEFDGVSASARFQLCHPGPKIRNQILRAAGALMCCIIRD